MARKKSAEEHENHERWLVSYADFITLLFAFFVVMYAVSSVNEGKYRVLSDSMVAAFRSPMKSLEPIQIGTPTKSQDKLNFGLPRGPRAAAPVAVPPVRGRPPFDLPFRMDDRKRRPHRVPPAPPPPMRPPIQVSVPELPEGKRDVGITMREVARQIDQAMAELIQRDLINVRRTSLWIEVEIKNSILFPSGSATLEPSAVPVLQKLAEILRQFPNPLQVEGFTDNIPIRSTVFPSNWELSAGRAASVVHLFTELGIEPERMAAIGYGEHRPNGDNSTPEGRQKNRRVVLVILANPAAPRMLAMERPASASSGPDQQAPAPEQGPQPHTAGPPKTADLGTRSLKKEQAN